MYKRQVPELEHAYRSQHDHYEPGQHTSSLEPKMDNWMDGWGDSPTVTMDELVVLGAPGRNRTYDLRFRNAVE